MKKSTLFVLLLAAVLLFMTACNPATKEPAATDDPTSIPGVAEDPNVPSKDKFEKANDTDISNIMSALSQMNIYACDSGISTVSHKYTFTIKKDAKIFDISQGNERKVSGSITEDFSSESTYEKTESGANKPYSKVTIYNGTVIIGDGDDKDVYVMSDFTVKIVPNENDPSGVTTYQGSLKLNGTELIDPNNTNSDSFNNYYITIMPRIIYEDISEKEIDEDVYIKTFNFDSESTKGNLSIKMDRTDPNNSYQVIMVNFSKLNDSSLTAKIVEYLTFDEKGMPTVTDVQIEYASLNGRYFTSDSLTNSKEFMNLLTSISQVK
ncbi:MAG: hypothetical protein MR563_04595 [Spirochaetales bacterium]|nr:hypothetical protein [Spirochaetales bacterium]